MPSGRVRSESSRLAILSATRELLLELGYEKLSIDQIAARAGVGKQTIYRWWASKGAVVADAALDGNVTPALEELPDTGDIRTDLATWLHAWVTRAATPEGSGLILALTAAGSDDKAIADRLYSEFSGPHEALLRARLQAAQQAGQLRADVELAAVASTLIGSLLYRVLGRHALPSETDADALLDLVLRGAGINPR
jgi:AcrR family transcriptional regulator